MFWLFYILFSVTYKLRLKLHNACVSIHSMNILFAEYQKVIMESYHILTLQLNLNLTTHV